MSFKDSARMYSVANLVMSGANFHVHPGLYILQLAYNVDTTCRNAQCVIHETFCVTIIVSFDGSEIHDMKGKLC